MITFVGLVDANAPVKHYMRDLRMDLGDFRIHLKYVEYYRLYIQMHDEIAELAKGKRGATILQKAHINNEMRLKRAEWEPRLREAKKTNEL